jgi:hypothetical protein
MTIGRIWAGNAFGTHVGKLFVSLNGEDHQLSGRLHLNEVDSGMIVYEIGGTFDGHILNLAGTANFESDGESVSELNAEAVLQTDGNLKGLWHTNFGAAGTFRLFPHDVPNSASTTNIPDQIHTANHSFGPIQINRDQLVALAEELQRDFTQGRVIVTFVAGTEQTRFLEDFRDLTSTSNRADLVKLNIRVPDGGIDKIVTVEFGQSANWAMAQGASEPWALGQLEKLKREIRKFERFYLARKGFGVGLNQLMFLWALVLLPSLPSLSTRLIMMVGVVGLAYCVNWLHNRFLPHATIYLNEPQRGLLSKLVSSSGSWIIGIAANVLAALLAAYLSGLLKLPVQ